MAALEEVDTGIDLIVIALVIGVIVFVLNEVANIGAGTQGLISNLFGSSAVPPGSQTIGGYDAIGSDGKTYTCDTFGYCTPVICDATGNCTKSGPAVLGTTVGITKPAQ